MSLVAAALVVLAIRLSLPPSASPVAAHREAIIHPGPERMVLADGSVVDLNTGARIETEFTLAERRVNLVSGEAHFTVAKNTQRPFVVMVDGIGVRAVGTAFSVVRDTEKISVLVTEGTVSLDERGPDSVEHPRELSRLAAGQRATIDPSALEVAINEITPAEVDRSLSWQGLRLEFVDMSLADVVVAFNRYNPQTLVIGDQSTARIRIAGTFRADNVNGFVRLLDTGFGVSSRVKDDEILLYQER